MYCLLLCALDFRRCPQEKNWKIGVVGNPAQVDDLETKLDAAVSSLEKLEYDLAKCCGGRKLVHFTKELNKHSQRKFSQITLSMTDSYIIIIIIIIIGA